MTVAVTPMYDATHNGIASLPRGQAAGYTTGSGGIAWTAVDWAAHPGAVRIDQDPAARDPTADVLDVEGGAATPADCPGWYKAALADYQSAKRPGQRYPAVYCSLSTLTAVANAFVSAGVTSGPKLWIAHWGIPEPSAAALIQLTAGTPFEVIAVQYASPGAYDVNVASVPWLAAGSAPPHWAYPAPGSFGAVASRAVQLRWAPAVPPAGEPPAGSYTVQVLTAGSHALVKQAVVTGTAAVVFLNQAGMYEARVWANGAPDAPPHASVTFTV